MESRNDLDADLAPLMPANHDLCMLTSPHPKRPAALSARRLAAEASAN